jgi:Fe2+ transport system protein FeoA
MIHDNRRATKRQRSTIHDHRVGAANRGSQRPTNRAALLRASLPSESKEYQIEGPEGKGCGWVRQHHLVCRRQKKGRLQCGFLRRGNSLEVGKGFNDGRRLRVSKWVKLPGPPLDRPIEGYQKDKSNPAVRRRVRSFCEVPGEEFASLVPPLGEPSLFQTRTTNVALRGPTWQRFPKKSLPNRPATCKNVGTGDPFAACSRRGMEPAKIPGDPRRCILKR